MTEELYLLIVALANVAACGFNTMFALRNLTISRVNADNARANADTAERLLNIASKQGVVVLQRNR